MIFLTKKEEFKKFARSNPILANYVENNEMTWQKFYELYDLYGDDEKIWSKYKNDTRSLNLSDGINKISKIVKNMDMESIKNHIDTAQKAIDLVGDLTSKKNSQQVISKEQVSPRPINKFFED